MKLISLIAQVKNMEEAREVAQRELPDVEFDLIDLYLVDKIDLLSEVKFVHAEESPFTSLFVEADGIKYVNLFPLNMLQDLVQDYSRGTDNDLEIGERITEYRINNA